MVEYYYVLMAWTTGFFVGGILGIFMMNREFKRVIAELEQLNERHR